MCWAHYHHLNAFRATVPTFILTFCCVFPSNVQKFHKNKTKSFKRRRRHQIRRRRCSHHHRCVHCITAYFLYKVKSHISFLLKVFTLLGYLVCVRVFFCFYSRLLFFCGIVIGYLFHWCYADVFMSCIWLFWLCLCSFLEYGLFLNKTNIGFVWVL